MFNFFNNQQDNKNITKYMQLEIVLMNLHRFAIN